MGGARLKEPLPRARVDGLADAAQDAQRGPVVLLHPPVALQGTRKNGRLNIRKTENVGPAVCASVAL